MSRPRPEENESQNPSTNESLEAIVQKRISRRGVLAGGLGGATSFVFGRWLTACSSEDGVGGVDAGADVFVPDAMAPTDGASPDAAPPKPLALGFQPVPKSLADMVTVPAGYSVTVVYRLGDPIAAGVAAYANDGTDSGDSHALRSGDHADGMHFFGMNAAGSHDPAASDRALLVMNHEAITPAYLHVTGPTIAGNGAAAVRTVADEVIKEMNSQGVSVIEIARTSGKWAYVQTGAKNRRVTTATPMDMSGPAKGSALLVTKYSTNGQKTRGTLNNCANGYTPWGTYLTCEENWAGYFRRLAADNANRTAKELAAFARYGVVGNGRELWATVTPDTAEELFGRWNAEKIGGSADGSDDYRNAPNTFGWIVEIDPFNPASTPRKRTALGRFAHEVCWPGIPVAGQPLVWYMGDDSRGEYIYKFVSTAVWDPADAKGGLAAGDKYMDSGKLYAAKFGADGTGTWLELAFGVNGITAANPTFAFADLADVLVHARIAADVAGATKMDRPEWAAVNPKNGEIYVTCTNGNAASRPVTAVDAANPRSYNDPKGQPPVDQKGNPNGHVIRIAEDAGKGNATTFRWDIFLFGARSTADATNVNLSGLTAANDLSSPDGCWFSQAHPGLLWLQTDDGAYTDVTNCMLLAAVPGVVGDGGKRTVTNVDGATTKAVDTWIGKPLGETNLRRFLTGPSECEITGIAESPDGKTLFINVQHPGEDTVPDFGNPASFGSHWPEGGNARPRSATIAITRDDGGPVGIAD